MPDQQDLSSHPPPPETLTRDSPPLTPPESNLNGADQRQSRKREREVSLEPANTPKALSTDETDATEARDARAPAKRNKRSLESTKEEVEEGPGKSSSRSRSRSHSVSPPIGIGFSPRHEMRIQVRQISQGVEGLNWKTPKCVDKGEQTQETIASSTLALSAEVDEKTSDVENVVIADLEGRGSPQSPQQGAADKDTALCTEGADNDATSASAAPPVEQMLLHNKSEGGEKGLKRRFEDRGTSQGPDEGDVTSKNQEPLKRPREDEDEDPNPRETKRPTPPPETKEKSPKSSSASPNISSKQTGFMAYASVSPLAAAAKGPNIFSSGKNTPASIFAGSPPSTPLSGFTGYGEASSSPPKRSGFGAFASMPSPFSSFTRSKSPVIGQTSNFGRAKSSPRRSNSVTSNPFASYIGNHQGFGVSATMHVRADSPPESSQRSLDKNWTPNALNPNRSQSSEEEEEGPGSFGEKLRAARDEGEDEDSTRSKFYPDSAVREQLVTGEEDDNTIYEVSSKLYYLDQGRWKERGKGVIKLNISNSDRTRARLVMHRDTVRTLLLNVNLFHGMKCAVPEDDPRYLTFSAIENGSAAHYNLRLKSAEAAAGLLKKIRSNIPPA